MESKTMFSSERTSEEYLTLNSCGIENLCDADRGSCRKNGRIDYHILYIAKGVCRLTLDGEDRNVTEGGVILFRPGEPQIYGFTARDRSVSHYIHFTGKGAGGLLKALGIDRIKLFDMGRSHSYEEISAKMASEYSMKKPFWESCCSAYLHELLNIIARKYALRSSNISRASEGRINAACRRIYENYADPPGVSALAAECCLSESRFTHLFSEVTGKSPKEFTLSVRICRAKELLGSTDLTVREVGEAVGYSDQNYFSRLFRRLTGRSPSAFRRENNED